MKKLFALLAMLSAGACAHQTAGGGGGAFAFGEIPEGRYYDCLDPTAYPCGYDSGFSPGAALARRTISPTAGHRPVARLVAREDVGGGGADTTARTAGTSGDRMEIHRASGGAGTGLGTVASHGGAGSVSSGHSAPSAPSAPPAISLSSPSASAPAPSGSVHASKQ